MKSHCHNGFSFSNGLGGLSIFTAAALVLCTFHRDASRRRDAYGTGGFGDLWVRRFPLLLIAFGTQRVLRGGVSRYLFHFLVVLAVIVVFVIVVVVALFVFVLLLGVVVVK